MNELFDIRLQKPDAVIYKDIKKNWDSVSKPIDGLGDFEELLCRIGAIQRSSVPKIQNRAALIYCADNGIVEEKISQSDKSITEAVARALGAGISSACHLGKFAGVRVIPVDVGIDSSEEIDGVINMKVTSGTKNFLKEPAMTKEEALKAIECGISMVKKLSGEGYDIISTGEMGIGNTTTAAAVLSAALCTSPERLVGRGAGLSDDGLIRKKQVVKKALEKYDFAAIADEREQALSILMSVGGLDIAALTGTFIGGALCNIPIVLDGVISGAAAVIADKIVPGTRDYMIASHRGREAGNELALNALLLSPYLDGNMALGEGTGALMLFPLLDMVMDYYENGARFSDYKIDEYERLS